jgi:hypothetical protein
MRAVRLLTLGVRMLSVLSAIRPSLSPWTLSSSGGVSVVGVAAFEPHLDEARVVKAGQVPSNGLVIRGRAEPAGHRSRRNPAIIAAGRASRGFEALE